MDTGADGHRSGCSRSGCRSTLREHEHYRTHGSGYSAVVSSSEEDGRMARTFAVDPADVVQTLVALRRLLAAVEAGDVDANPEQLAHLRGSVEALGALLAG